MKFYAVECLKKNGKPFKTRRFVARTDEWHVGAWTDLYAFDLSGAADAIDQISRNGAWMGCVYDPIPADRLRIVEHPNPPSRPNPLTYPVRQMVK